eukprot:8839576-Pyramimonas_sp.AAC.1
MAHPAGARLAFDGRGRNLWRNQQLPVSCPTVEGAAYGARSGRSRHVFYVRRPSNRAGFGARHSAPS